MVSSVLMVAFALAGDGPREQAPRPKAAAATAPVVDAATAIALEWGAPESIRTNAANDVTLTVRNTTGQPAQRVVVQVRLPEGVTAGAIVPAPKREQGILLWEFGTIAGHESRTIQMPLTTTVKKDLDCQAWVTTTGTAGMKLAVREPKLRLKLTAPREAVRGDVIPIAYELTNVGDADATQPHLTTTHRAVPIADSERRPLGDALKPGQTVRGESKWLVDQGGVDSFAVVATADGVQAEETATVKVLVPKLTVAIAGPTTRQMGRKATYTVTVTNAGDVPLKDVTVREAFPAEFQLQRASQTYSLDKGTATWTVGELIAGQAKLFTYDAVAVCPGPAVHEVKATGSRNTEAMTGLKTVVEGVPALRMEVVDAADPVETGGTTTYEIKLTNTGTRADHQLVLECRLPPELRYVKSAGPTAGVERDGTLRFDPVSTLAAKTEVVYTVTVKAVAAGDVRFRATVTTAGLTKPVVKDESTRIYGE